MIRLVNRRPNPSRRGYGARWAKAAKAFRYSNPMCIGCKAIGRDEIAEVVDHIVPHKGDDALFWSEDNWQACCRWHHSAVKQELESRYERGEASPHDLRLNSSAAIALSLRTERKPLGADGWPVE